MKLTWYLATATTVAAASYPVYGHQQPVGSSLPASQGDIEAIEALGLENLVDNDPLLSLHRDLVEIESISGNEHNVSIFVAEYLESRNFTVIKQEVAPVKGNQGSDAGYSSKTRYNIYAYPSSLQEKPSILVSSHIDTVPPFIPYSARQPETQSNPNNLILAGRGTVDAKGSVAAQVFAVLETLQTKPDAKLALLFVVGEEIGGDGMKTFSNSDLNTQSAYHTVIFGEPTEAKLVSGHKGMLGFRVVANGKAAHSGYPWLGKSAVSAILPALSRVDQLGNISVSEGGLPSSSKYGPTTLNIGTIHAGVATNVVPAYARADVAVRLAAGTPEEARQIIRRAVEDATRDVEADVEVDFSHNNESYGPQDLDTDVDGFEVMPVNYGTDVPNLKVRDGVKRYLYGPGSIFVAHGDNEALTVRDLKDAVSGFKKLIDAALKRD